MRCLVGKSDNLVFDRGAVPRANTFDMTAVHGGEVDVLADDVMGRLIGMGHTARHLPNHRSGAHKGEQGRLVIAGLLFGPRPVNGLAVESGRGPGLQSPSLQAEIAHLISKLDRGQIPHPAARGTAGSNMNQAVKKRSGRQNSRPARNNASIRQLNTRKPTGVEREARHLSLNHRQVLFFGKKLLNRLAVQFAICLRPRPLNGRPLSPVQQSELNPGAICSARHNAIKGVYLTHEVALSQAPNRRIAGHHADTRPTQRDQRSRRAHAGSCRRRFRAGMPAPNDDDIKMFHVKHPHFPIQNREKISSSRSSTPTLPIIISSNTEAA